MRTTFLIGFKNQQQSIKESPAKKPQLPCQTQRKMSPPPLEDSYQHLQHVLNKQMPCHPQVCPLQFLAQFLLPLMLFLSCHASLLSLPMLLTA